MSTNEAFWGGEFVGDLLKKDGHPNELNGLTDWVGLALRRNPKRAHLYVSKVLGKHIPVKPSVLYKATAELAQQIRTLSDNPDRVVFGYAETATNLGALVARHLNSSYVCSTRYPRPNTVDHFSFEESHSHSTTHHLTLTSPDFFNVSQVVLVDDEITTGHTVLNTVKQLRLLHPSLTSFVVATFLDSRTNENVTAFNNEAKQLGVEIVVVALRTNNSPVTYSDTFLTETVPALKDAPITPAETSSTPILHSRLSTPPLRLAEGVRWQQLAEATATEFVPLTGSGKTLVLGVEENMFTPWCVANNLEKSGVDVFFSATTLSPALVVDDPGYALRDRVVYNVPDGTQRFAYNVGYDYDTIVVVADDNIPIGNLPEQLRSRTRRVIIATQTPKLPQPQREGFGSYPTSQVQWLLKDLTPYSLEAPTAEREAAIQAGTAHYSESLPQEYAPSEDYYRLYHEALNSHAPQVARAVASVAEQIMRTTNEVPILISLARAGTPIGILIRYYLHDIYGIWAPHYAVSIVRGKGIDVNALRYIASIYRNLDDTVFIDGWTGKGAITKELYAALDAVAKRYDNLTFPHKLAVLADPANCVNMYGTREDFLIPSACLNSTVSGLVSRTVLNTDLIGPDDFHGAKTYPEMKQWDVSKEFIDTIRNQFQTLQKSELITEPDPNTPTWAGWEFVLKVCKQHNISSPNMVKPGVGETTRVLLRRIPDSIIIKPGQEHNLQHVLMLAKDRGVPVLTDPDMPYSCVGLIKDGIDS